MNSTSQYCCYFDHRYLPRGLAMIRSLKRWDSEATVWVLCLSDDCHRVLTEIDEPNVRLLRMAEIEERYPALAEARSNRSLIEYYFTCTPSLVRYALDEIPPGAVVTYVDSDLHFYASPEPLFRELGREAVSIIPHRFPAQLRHLEKYGLYNVGWMSFRNDERGNAVARWWQERCNEWCYDLLDGERFADQKYLDRIATDFEGVVILAHPGANLAPWNLANHVLSREGDQLLVDRHWPLIFFHFHGLRRSSRRLYIPGHFRYEAPFTRLVRDALYRPYIRVLEDIALETANYFTVPKRALTRQTSSRTHQWDQFVAQVKKPIKDAVAILRGEFVLVPAENRSTSLVAPRSPKPTRATHPSGLRVVVVHNYYGSSAPSGENNAVDAEIAMLRRAGHDVHVFTRRSDEIREEGFRGLAHGGFAYTWNPFELFRIRRYLRETRPHVVHVHNTFPLISPAIFWIANEVAASVLTLHNYRLFCAGALLLRDGRVCTECLDRSSVLPAVRHGCYRGSRIATLPVAQSIALHKAIGTWRERVDAYIAVTDFQRERMVRAGLPEDRVYVKPNFFSGAPSVVRWESRRAQVVYVGRLSTEKGVPDLIRAWLQWGAAAPPLLIIGDGPLRAELEQLCAAHNATNIKFLGALPHGSAIREIAESKLLVVPSIWFEGFPVVLQEAFAAGTPVAVSNIGALPSIIRAGKNGLLFEPRNPQGIEQVIAAAWGDEPLMRQLSAGARASFEAHYTEQANQGMLVEIYMHAIERREQALRATA